MKTKLSPETSSLKKATDLYEWLFQIIINRLPINATKWDRMDKFTQSHMFNRKTVTKYICLLAEYVAIKIKDDLKSVDMVNIDDFKDKYNDPDDAVDYGEEMKDYDEFMSEVEIEEDYDESSDNSEESE